MRAHLKLRLSLDMIQTDGVASCAIQLFFANECYQIGGFEKYGGQRLQHTVFEYMWIVVLDNHSDES